MTGPYPPQQPDPAHYGPPPGAPPQPGPPQYGPPQYGPPQYGPPQYGPPQYGPPQYPPQFAMQPARPPRDKMVVALVAIIATLLVLCLAMAIGSVYFLREEPGGDDKTSEIVDYRPAGG